jgi:hypothetical protein
MSDYSSDNTLATPEPLNGAVTYSEPDYLLYISQILPERARSFDGTKVLTEKELFDAFLKLFTEKFQTKTPKKGESYGN